MLQNTIMDDSQKQKIIQRASLAVRQENLSK